MTRRGKRSLALLGITATLAVTACSFSPLAHRIDVGHEPFVIFVGEGVDHHTDLFAVSADGGNVAQVTFTALVESDPQLTPTGEVVAFLRADSAAAAAPVRVILMNLLSGAELPIPLPDSAGRPTALAWSDDGTALYIRTSTGVWQTPARPGATTVRRLAGSDIARADTILGRWLGTPRFARAIACSGGMGACVIGARGDTAVLAPGGHDPMRWGGDSVAWFDGDMIAVRSLGPGHAREINWRNGPEHPRDGTFARGIVPTS